VGDEERWHLRLQGRTHDLGRRRNGGACLRGRRAIFARVGFRAVESTPAFGNAGPFAGPRGNDGLDRFMRTKGAIQPFVRRIDDDQGVLEKLPRRGTFILAEPAAAGGERGVLRSAVTRLVAVHRGRRTRLAASEGWDARIAASDDRGQRDCLRGRPSW